jgi:hypothetical protein
MSLVNNAPTNQRLLTDLTFVKSATLATGVAGSIDLVQSVPYPTTEQVVLNVTTTILSGSNTTATFTVQDSADNSSFSNVGLLGAKAVTVTSPGVVGAVVASYALPVNVRQYVRVSSSISGATTGGFTSSLAF